MRECQLAGIWDLKAQVTQALSDWRVNLSSRQHLLGMVPSTSLYIVPSTLFRLTSDVLPVFFVFFFLSETLGLLLPSELVNAIEHQLLQLGKCVLGLYSRLLPVLNSPHLLHEGVLVFSLFFHKKLGVIQVGLAQHPSCVTPYAFELLQLIKHMVDEVDNHHHKPTIRLVAATIIDAKWDI